MITITSIPSNNPIAFKHHIFSAGEQHVSVAAEGVTACLITLRYSQDSDLVLLMLIVDSLRRQDVEHISLYIPYFPGARQDQLCNPGESLSVSVYADIINALKFDRVTILDAHSGVTLALVNRINHIKNHKLVLDSIEKIVRLNRCAMSDIILISPDAGANKKAAALQNDVAIHTLHHVPVIRCDKLRDTANHGKIVETTVYADSLQDKVCIIPDDICSYGGTFCALGKALKSKGAAKVYLVVSHYEGRADPHKLEANGIDGVFTTDSHGNALLGNGINTFIYATDVMNFYNTPTHDTEA